MFDDLDKQNAQNATPPAPLVRGEAKAEDMFAEVDKTGKPEVFQPKPANTPPYATVVPREQTWKDKKGLIFGSLAAVLVVAIGGYLGLKFFASDQAAPVSSPIQTEIKNTSPETATTPEPVVEITLPEPVQPAETAVTPEPLDSDQDGLTDEEEAALGTNANNIDSDQDGLTDREEVKVYQTDPLNSDTDGDGYKDGEEIASGYNPKGQGKLLEIKP
ncbi:MAG: hypothetical protein AUJ11_00420 [Parcubacteria group bacterium CG1_02_44_65]|nr:MAG: hypothetical protein AUJ11_00420 [Parcubacteria group bacterium CG1_02_44_65]